MASHPYKSFPTPHPSHGQENPPPAAPLLLLWSNPQCSPVLTVCQHAPPWLSLSTGDALLLLDPLVLLFSLPHEQFPEESMGLSPSPPVPLSVLTPMSPAHGGLPWPATSKILTCIAGPGSVFLLSTSHHQPYIHQKTPQTKPCLLSPYKYLNAMA